MSSVSEPRRPLAGAMRLASMALIVTMVSGCGPTPSGGRRVPAGAPPVDTPTLRVCADPNNLPFSNQLGEGFENELAQLVAHELNMRVEYTWWPQRRGFIRTTLAASVCDVVMGVPHEFELVLTTLPYYRSSYVLVTRRERGMRIRSIDDPRLRQLLIGVH